MPGKHLGKGKLIYFSDEEMAVIQRKAKKAKMNITKYIRKMAVDGSITIYDLKDAHNLIYEINKIGVNVNQLAKKANEINNIYKVDIEMMKQEYENLCHMLNQFLLKLPSTKV